MEDQFLINLQLFADPKVPPDEVETESEEEILDDVDNEEEVEDDADEEIEEPTVEDEVKPKKDKVTAALIREKQANKALRDKLAASEREKAAREQESNDRQYKQKLLDSGNYSEEEIDEKVSLRRDNEEIKRELKNIKYGQQVEKLAAKYPAIHEHLNEFIKIVEDTKGAVTLDELCKAKLDATTTQELRTKVEQESLINRNKAKEKKTVVGESKPAASVKFSAEDEAAFKYYATRNPGKTRDDYKKILEITKG